MQPGIVGLRRAITESWENDLRAVRQDRYDVDKGKEAWSFIQRFYTMVSDLRSPIQRAWGPGGMVHVADSTEIGGPGPPVSLPPVKLPNPGGPVPVGGATPSDDEAGPNPRPGLAPDNAVSAVPPLT